MLSSNSVEDIFIDFCRLFHTGKIPVQPHDVSVINNFENVIQDQKALTQNQGNYILKILQKYQSFSYLNGLDYSSIISDPVWKQDFRILDLSKKIFVSQDDENTIWVCLKFPYQLKKEFDSMFTNDAHPFQWDHDNKIRKEKLYKCNLISLYEFAQKNSFEIDDSFMSAMAQVEEIWQNQEDIAPSCTDEGGKIVLKNACQEALEYFNENFSDSRNSNLLLAKSMGFLYDKKSRNPIETIASVENNYFWVKNFEEYFNLIESIDGKIVIILDRAADAFDWLKTFSEFSEKFQVSSEKIKVCFREEKNIDQGLNRWIKDKGYGGKVEEGKILIFLQKPAKWLFKDIKSVKIVTTTNLYPPPNPITRDFFNSQSCVIYLGDIKPSEKKDQRIVEL